MNCTQQNEIVKDIVFHLYFLDKPVITCPQYVIYAPKGEGVSLKCVLHSNPGAMVTWSYGADKVHATEVDPGNANSRMSIKESVCLYYLNVRHN